MLIETFTKIWRVSMVINVLDRAKFIDEGSGCKDGGRELIRFLSSRREIKARTVGVPETTDESAVMKFHLS
jgi:hypothetical protein